MPFFTINNLISMFSVWLLLVSILLFLIVLYWRLVTGKGYLGERRVHRTCQRGLPRQTYRIFFDVTLPTPDGTTQIDHLIVSPFGIFVIETKTMKGWIFGGLRQKTWTQKIYRHTSKFQNPLHQNYKHIKTLEAALEIPLDQLISIVVFAGSAKLKTRMPENVVRLDGLLRLIRSRQDVVFSPKEVEANAAKIEALRLRRSLKTRRAHVRHVQEIVAEKARPSCPLCAGKMERRVVSGGKLAGQKFWGCLRFPDCRGVIVIDPKEPA